MAVRSRQVHRSCHQKLWRTASATASAVAGSYGQPTACVNSASVPSWSTNPIAPTVTKREMRRLMRPSIRRPAPGAVPPRVAPACWKPRSRRTQAPAPRSRQSRPDRTAGRPGAQRQPTETQTAFNAPTPRTIRSSVGPNPRNDMRKIPAAWVARYDSAVTSRYAASRVTARVGFMSPEQASLRDSPTVPARSIDVIDIEAVARPLLSAHARHRAVEAVAEPVREQRHDDAERGPRGDTKAGKRHAGRQHREERQGREVV